MVRRVPCARQEPTDEIAEVYQVKDAVGQHAELEAEDIEHDICDDHAFHHELQLRLH